MFPDESIGATFFTLSSAPAHNVNSIHFTGGLHLITQRVKTSVDWDLYSSSCTPCVPICVADKVRDLTIFFLALLVN